MGQDAYLAFLAGNCMINCPQYTKEVEIEKLIEMGESSTVEFIDLAIKHYCVIITAHGVNTTKTKPQTYID